MQVVVLANEKQKAALTYQEESTIVWVDDVNAFSAHSTADVLIDLLYTNTGQRNKLLESLLPKTVVINSVTDTLQETNPGFVRINGWNSFLSSPLIEASANNPSLQARVEEAFA